MTNDEVLEYILCRMNELALGTNCTSLTTDLREAVERDQKKRRFSHRNAKSVCASDLKALRCAAQLDEVLSVGGADMHEKVEILLENFGGQLPQDCPRITVELVADSTFGGKGPKETACHLVHRSIRNAPSPRTIRKHKPWSWTSADWRKAERLEARLSPEVAIASICEKHGITDVQRALAMGRTRLEGMRLGRALARSSRTIEPALAGSLKRLEILHCEVDVSGPSGRRREASVLAFEVRGSDLEKTLISCAVPSVDPNWKVHEATETLVVPNSMHGVQSVPVARRVTYRPPNGIEIIETFPLTQV